MTYDPAADLAACTEGTVVGQIRSITVPGWFQETDQLILEAQGSRFQVEGSHIVFDYPTSALSFKPNQSDTLIIGTKTYPIDRAILEGGGLMTKLLLGFPT